MKKQTSIGLAIFVWAAVSSSLLAAVNPPGAASFSSVTASQVQANWTDGGNAAGTTYYVILSTGASPSTNGFTGNISSTTLNLNALFTNLSANTNYFADVAAIDIDGSTSTFTSLGSTTTASIASNPPTAAPFSNVTASQVQANWNANGNPPGTTYTAILSTGSSPSTNGLSGNIHQTTTSTSFVFTNLAVNTLYFVDVQAGGSAFVALGSVSTLANVPTPAGATNVQTNGFTANWAPNGNPLGTTYTAQLSTDPGFSSITASSSTLSTSLSFAGLTPNTTYFSRVEAINRNGVATTFAALPTVFTLTNAPGPNAFTNITTSQVQANWTANGNPGGTQYTVILSTGASPSTNGLSGNTSLVTTNIFALFTGLAVNTAYFADVKAEGSVFTTLGSAPTLANPPTPANPTNVGVHQITANWGTNGNPPGTSYLVQASTDVGFGSIAASVSVTVSSATLTGLSPNTAYFMRVQALNLADIPTTTVALPSATTLEDIPNAPGVAPFTNVTVSQLQANWTANGNPPDTSYTAILSTAPSPATNNLASNQSMTVSATSVIFTGLSPNKLYFVDVKAVTPGGSSAPTSLGSIATLANSPAQASPTNISANQITANWGANGNPAGTTYVIQASTDSAFGSIATAVTTFASSATLTGLSANTLYFMQVQAINQNNVSTSFTALPNAMTLQPIPNAPLPAAFSNVTTNQLQANWTANGNPPGTSYTAILSTAASPATNGLASNQSVTTSNLSTIFSSLLPNVLYFVDVKATSSGGSSAATGLGSIATFANPPTASAPSNIGANQITANWGINGNPAGTAYLIQASTDSAFGSIATAITTTASSATLTGLLSNTAYFMQVQATNQSGVGTIFTALPSALTLQNIPNAPGVVGFSNVTAVQLQASWTTNGNPSYVTYTAVLSSAASPSTNNLPGNQSVTSSTTSVTFTGLVPNVMYFVEVKATSTGGSSPYSSLGSVPTLANPPISAAPTNIQPNQITANWTANGNSAGTPYLVQASLDSSFTSITVAVSTTSLSAALTGLSPQTQYFMRVQAKNQSGLTTAFILLPSATTLSNPPNAPASAGFSNVSANQLQSNWLSNGNPAGTTYTAILSTASSPSTNGLPGNQTITASTTSAVFSSLFPNTLYFVQVKASNAGGDSVYTDLGSVPTLANAPASAVPSGIQTNQITANWGTSGNPSGTSYLVQASPDSGFATIASGKTTTASSATLTGLLANTTYFMRVQATNQSGLSTSFTSLPSAVTLNNPPGPPGSAGFSNVATNQLQANWTANGNPSGTTYTAILSTAPSPSTNGLSGNQSVTTTNIFTTFSSLIPNTLYYVDVNASEQGSNSAYTALGSVPTLANAPTSANPTNILTNQITANWGTNGNPAGTQYLVQASADSGFATITSAKTTVTSSATLNGLLATTQYFFRVQATNQSGLATAFTPLPSASTVGNPPAAPGGAGFSNVTINQIQANWTANGNPAGTTYTAILSTAASPSTNNLAGNQSVTTSSTSVAFSGLFPNTIYFVQVKASNAGGDSAFTDLGSVPTLANAPVSGAPTNIGANQITANWGTNNNPAGTTYLVQASPDAGFVSIASGKTTTASSATLTGLTANTLYNMRVQAINQSGLATAFTLLPSATTANNPPGPPGSAGFSNVTVNQIQANWTANGNPGGTTYTAILSTAPSPSTNGLPGNQSNATTNTSTTFSTLLPNTLYYVDVNATNGSNSSVYTALGSVPTLANAPTSASPTNILTNQITANWGTNGNPAGTQYLVQASADAGFGTITSAITTVASSATLNGLLATTPYFFRVQATNQSGLSTAFTPLPSASTVGNPPAAPGSGGFSNVTTAQIQTNWTANGNPTGTTYTAILSTAPSPGTNNLPGNQNVSTTLFSATFSSLFPNTLYFVQVKASNAGGDSAFTDLGSVPTLANAPVSGAPTNIEANQITANWGTNNNPAGTTYLVQASPDSGFVSIASGQTTTASSATLTGLLADTTYFMRVQATNQSGLATSFTLLPSAITLNSPPGSPGSAGFSNVAAGQLQANWTANGNPGGTTYKAILSTAPSPSTNGLSGNQSNSTTNTSTTFSNLSPNTLYYVDVNASNQGSNSAYTSLGSVPTLANTPTSASPTNILTNQITANWGTNGNPAGTQYLVQASADAGFATIASAKTTTASSATLNGLLPTTQYFFQVHAINQSGLVTPFTPLPSAITSTVPPTAPGSAGFNNVTISQLQANWTANGNPAGTTYTAILSTAASPSTNNLAGNQSVTTSSASVVFSSLSPNTLYFVQVKASNGGGDSAFTDLGSVATLASTPTSGLPTGIQTNQITANWGTNGNPFGTTYLVQASVDASFDSIASAKTTTASSATLNGLLPTTLYFMQVQAFNQSGLATSFTFLPSTATLQNPPSVPAGAGFSNITITQLTANWTANGNLSGTTYTAIVSSAPSPITNNLSGNQSVTTTGDFATFSGLSPNTLYYVQVKASNAGGSSAFSDLGSAATLANAPSSANPTGITGSQIIANWLANGNPAGTIYRVQASVDPGFAFISVGIATTSLSATFSGLTPQTTYYMQVQAVNFSGTGTSFTPLPTVLTLGNPPVAPGAASFSNVTTSQLQANWTQNGNSAGTSYLVILSSAPSPSTNNLAGNRTLTGTGIFAIFTGLLPNTVYYADVQAANSNGNSVFTGLGNTATLANAPVPGNPSNVGANLLTTNWGANGNPNGTSYVIQASLDSGFASIALTNTSTNTFSTLLGLSPNTTYYTRVQAINQNFVGTAFTVLPATTTLANAPALPISLPFTNVTTTQVQANWSANGNPPGTSYTVVLSTQPSPSSNGLPGNHTTVTTGSFVLYSSLQPNTFYYADVQATNSTGASGQTSLGSAITLANAPTSLAPSGIGISQFTTNWGADGNPNGTLYLVQASLAPDFSSLIAFNISTTTTFVFSGLSANTTYYTRVRAINQGGISTVDTVLPPAQTVITLPTIPVFTAAQITDTAITWSWSPGAANAIGYSVFDQNNIQVSPSFDSSVLQWQETGLAVNTSYSRRVVAFNASGASSSTLITVFTLAHQPTNLTVQDIESNSITIAWNANGNPLSTQYVAQVSQGPGTARTITVTQTQATFDNLAGATTYFFTVQAVNGAGIAAAAGNSLTATTLAQLATFGQICSPQASTLAFNGPKGPVRVDIPSGAFAGCIQMTVKIPGTFPNAPSSGTPLRGTGVGLELDANVSVQPSVPLTLSVPFTNADVSAAERSQLVLARYDPVHNLWIMLHSSVDPEQNVVTGQTDHLSLYQVMVALPSANLSAINIYPNPFRPSLGHTGVNFTNLPADAGIQLYTITGEKVQSLSSSATGTAFWDGRNESGQPVASGIYFAVVKSGSAKSILKVAVQR